MSDKKSLVTMIVAVGTDGSIFTWDDNGRKNIPWPYLAADKSHLRNVMKESVDRGDLFLLGPGTFADMKKILPDNCDYLVVANNVTFAQVIQDHPDRNVLVLGGRKLYQETLTSGILDVLHYTSVGYEIPPYPRVRKGDLRFSHASLRYYQKKGHLTKISHTCHVANFWNIHYDITTFQVNGVLMLDPVKKEEIVIPAGSEGERSYLQLVQEIYHNGFSAQTRNSKTLSLFGRTIQWDMSGNKLPILTTKRVPIKSVIVEALWMMKGMTDVEWLRKNKCNIWNANSSQEFLRDRGLSLEEGDIGPGYGFQMRHYGAPYESCHTDYTGQGVDQLQNCMDLIINDPHSRRIVMNLWNPTQNDEIALPPCHVNYQWSVKDGRLHCLLYQRSWDILLGWNHTTAAIFTFVMAKKANLEPGILTHVIGDVHLYESHWQSREFGELLSRVPRDLPTLTVLASKEWREYEIDDFVVQDYYPSSSLSFQMVA